MSKKSIFRSGVSTSIQPVPIIRFSTIIHMQENNVFKLVGKTLHISEDYGVNYSKILNFENVLNEIRFIHLFSNGTLLLGDHKRLAYSNDMINLNYSNVKDINGNTYVPKINYDNFSLVNGSSIQKINNNTKEVLMWGNYNNSENTSASPNCFIWYTDDYGVNVKCIFHFGVSKCDNTNQTLQARHVHDVAYNSADNTFWFCTGDEPAEVNTHWVQVLPNGNSFTFNWIATGYYYQVSNLQFIDDYIYASFDMAGGGLVRIPYNQAHDVTKFENLKVGLNDILFTHVQNNNAIIVQSRWKGTQEGRRFWYSPDLENNLWVEIYGDMPEGYTDKSIYCRVYKPNSRGMMLSGIQMNYNQGYHLYNFTPSVWLNDVLAKNGFPNAFK